MSIELKQRLHDAIEACRAIQSFTNGITYEKYAESLLHRSGVERQFEILGEALGRAELLNPSLSQSIPDIRRIVGLRNRIIHGYDSVDDEIIWDAVQTHVPKLLPVLLRELAIIPQ
jgi:uncharacterized protein with HEPN domain